MPIGSTPPKGFKWKTKMRRQKRLPRKELRQIQRECKHQWEEQTGAEPIIDMKTGIMRLEQLCTNCGLAKK